ncbi:hypothetical protein FB468_0543 [Leucobacter komagatae]|uniref:Uncharacterized protein n=1 Tax=Leucobacter komagatae TaxID=55969 RepID=A0A542Y3A9_9MICO|nr:hypothetical protein FB468_0543 [Leucobacter komagatae]
MQLVRGGRACGEDARRIDEHLEREPRSIGRSPPLSEQAEFGERHSKREAPVVVPAAGMAHALPKLPGGSKRRAWPGHRDPDLISDASATPIASAAREPHDEPPGKPDPEACRPLAHWHAKLTDTQQQVCEFAGRKPRRGPSSFPISHGPSLAQFCAARVVLCSLGATP